MPYTWREFLGCKSSVSEAYVQERINAWRPGRYDISKAPVKTWRVDDPELIGKYQADWDDIHGNMGVIPDDFDITICNNFILLAAEKVKHMKAVYAGAYHTNHKIAEPKSTRDAAAIRMEEALEWASRFSLVNKEDIRNSWNHELESGKWTGGYIRFKVVETEKDKNSIGKERVGGRACK